MECLCKAQAVPYPHCSLVWCSQAEKMSVCVSKKKFRGAKTLQMWLVLEQ